MSDSSNALFTHVHREHPFRWFLEEALGRAKALAVGYLFGISWRLHDLPHLSLEIRPQSRALLSLTLHVQPLEAITMPPTLHHLVSALHHTDLLGFTPYT